MNWLYLLILLSGCGETAERPTAARAHLSHADCASEDPPDADRDGDPPMAFGGGDCDDDDPTVHRGAGCRSGVDCAHLRAAELATLAPPDTIDLAFDDRCGVWLITAGGGVVVLDRTGTPVQTWRARPPRAASPAPDASKIVGPDGAWFVAEGGRVLEIDPASGLSRVHAVASADVVDMAFDTDGTLFVEHAGDAIEAFAPDGLRRGIAAVHGDGRLAVSPDGWLVRLVPDAGAFQEWPLDP